MNTNIKSGYKTSELYVALIGIGSVVWNNVQAQCHFTTTDIWVIAGTVVTYIAGRSGLKIVNALIASKQVSVTK